MHIYQISFKEITKCIGIMELELTRLVCIIDSFSQLMKHWYFEVLVDQKAIEKSMKIQEITNNWLTTLLLTLWDCAFTLKYQQGKEMFINGALSRLHTEANEHMFSLFNLVVCFAWLHLCCQNGSLGWGTILP